MTVPVGMLVGFAAWTVLLLLATVGVYRRDSGCPHNAIADARMFRSDQHGGIRTLRVLFHADRQFSLVDWDPADQAEWNRITYSNTLGATHVR